MALLGRRNEEGAKDLRRETTKCSDSSGLLPRFESVSHPGLGLEVLFAASIFELAPQLADEDAQILRLVG